MEQITLKGHELQLLNIRFKMSPLSVTRPGMAEKLKSKHGIFLNSNLEDMDLIRTIIPPVETETGRLDISV